MEHVELWLICLNAFIAVLVLLSLLAVVMRLLTWLLPEAAGRQDDAPLVAAVQMAVARTWPGARVTRLEEINKG